MGLLLICAFPLLLCSCNERIEEEKFQLSFDDYPKIVTVPDRPKILSSQEISDIQTQLSVSREQSYAAAKDSQP